MSKIQILVNGKEKEMDVNATIKNILEELKITGPMVVVERNLEIVPKDKYDQIVSDGDKYEIVGIFGGG